MEHRPQYDIKRLSEEELKDLAGCVIENVSPRNFEIGDKTVTIIGLRLKDKEGNSFNISLQGSYTDKEGTKGGSVHINRTYIR